MQPDPYFDAGLQPWQQAASRQLFTDARTHHRWLDKAVPDALLARAWQWASLTATSMNCQPLRVVFVRGGAARQSLLAALNAGNVEKTAAAPVTAVFGHDLAFYRRLPDLFAHKADAVAYFEGQPQKIATTALRNSSLQAAQFMLAARLLGLDCGPMSGFDAARMDATFWAGTEVQTNFLCNLGYGDASALRVRPPRLSFEEVCRLV